MRTLGRISLTGSFLVERRHKFLTLSHLLVCRDRLCLSILFLFLVVTVSLILEVGCHVLIRIHNAARVGVDDVLDYIVLIVSVVFEIHHRFTV